VPSSADSQSLSPTSVAGVKAPPPMAVSSPHSGVELTNGYLPEKS
jgi:hypothetical protein